MYSSEPTEELGSRVTELTWTGPALVPSLLVPLHSFL